MNDLISRQAAIDEIDEWIKAFRENVHKESAADARFIRDGIIQLPSAQPEITRCKDCEHWTNDDCPFAWGKVEDAFCSYAERRNDE